MNAAKLIEELAAARGALAMIHNSVEPDAIKHPSYDALAKAIYVVAKAGLDGNFIDDMHCAEVYDTLYRRRWRYQRKEGWGDIWRETSIDPATPGFFEAPDDWNVEEFKGE